MAGPPFWWIVVFYAGLAFWMLLPGYRIKPPRAAALLSLWVVLAVISGKHPQQPNSLRCTFIDVGQGLSALLEFPDDSAILYDAGRLGSPSAAVRAISTTLWSRGRTHIDAIIISHADADHFNAVPELLERFSVGTIYLTPPMLRKEDDASRTLIAAISQKGVPIRPLTAGQTLRRNETQCRVLHPTAAGIAETRHGSVDNANSLVLLIEHLGNHILLTGDLEGAGLDRMLETEIPACDVLLAPHHGSRNSRPAEVVRWCRPTWSVISSGLVEPEPAVRRAYAEEDRHLLHTGRSGAIEATLRPAGVQIESQHGKNR